MYDIKPLEQEWKKYRKKRQKPWYIGGLVFLGLLLVAIFFTSNINIDLSKVITYFKTVKSESIASAKEETSIPEDDVKMVAEQTGKSEDEAKAALEETNGDIAEAISKLSE